jgi:hypothetical protein
MPHLEISQAEKIRSDPLAKKKAGQRFGPPAESKRNSYAELNLSAAQRRMDGSNPSAIRQVIADRVQENENWRIA